MRLSEPSEGGWTINWRGMVMRCGEHDAHTTLPHFLQWCFLYRKVKFLPHTGHCETSASGCQGGSTMSLPLLRGSVSSRGGRGGGSGGSGRVEAGDESSTIGSELDAPAVLECILILEGRLMGESAVVSRLLRSELCEDDESVRGGGRLGSVYRDDEECGAGWELGVVVVVVIVILVCDERLAFWSAKKSIHVSPSRAFGGCCAR
jgi:hypothetical protein